MQNRFWYLLSKKLSGHLSDAELIELEELQAAHPDWHHPVQHITNIWLHENPAKDAEDDFANHLKRMETLGHDISAFSIAEEENSIQLLPLSTSSNKGRWIWLAIAASVIGVIGWLFANESVTNPIAVPPDYQIAKNEVITGSGKRDKLVLPDGTQVWLNAESKIEYGQDFGKTNRDISLSGEAYFDVTKNKELPFTIQTNRIHIKVTGTAFNVKAYPGEKVSETSIIRGRVEVTVNARPKELYVLKPNEKLVIRDEPEAEKTEQTVVSNVQKQESKPLIQLGYINYIANDSDSATVETSWVFNRLVFDNESFTEMAVKMERWFGVKIRIDDPKVAAIRLNYQIQNETVEKALRNMQYVARFHFNVDGKNITITK